MAKQALLLCLGLGLLVGAAAQFSRGANEYTIESGATPLKSDVVFKTGDPDLERRAKLPEANIVIGIMSAPDHFEQRNAVRSSWMQLQSLTDPHLNDLTTDEKQKMVIRFIIGTPKDQALESLISKEFATYHDIVRVPVVEDYFSLTLKTGEFIKWADATYKMQWAFKCDDDSFVRVDKLLRELQKQPATGLYLGKVWTGTPVDRRVDSFAPWSTYASFAAGAGYAISWDLASYISRNYERLHKYPMEDVAVGMWLSPLKLTIVDHPHFHSYQEGCDKDMIVQNPAPSAIMQAVFFHSVNGVPCHMKPDPFDPKNKNITDHVLTQLGIPKPVTGARTTKHIDPLKAIGAQSLVDMDTVTIDQDPNNNNNAFAMMGETVAQDEMVEENAEDKAEESNAGGMGADVMNGNTPSNKAVDDMNKMGHGSKSQTAAEETAVAEKMMNANSGAGSVVMM